MIIDNIPYCFYWINLDDAIVRRKHMENIFTKNNIKNCRVQAIKGQDEKLDKQIACTLSHMKAINQFMESNDDVAIICEDDLSFTYRKYWKKSIQDIINNAPKDWEIIQLGAILHEYYIEDFYNSKEEYLPFKKGYYSAVAYAINRKGAKKIINLKLDLTDPDTYVADLLLYLSVKTYSYKYLPFTYKFFNSQIDLETDEGHIESKARIKDFLLRSTR